MVDNEEIHSVAFKSFSCYAEVLSKDLNNSINFKYYFEIKGSVENLKNEGIKEKRNVKRENKF